VFCSAKRQPRWVSRDLSGHKAASEFNRRTLFMPVIGISLPGACDTFFDLSELSLASKRSTDSFSYIRDRSWNETTLLPEILPAVLELWRVSG